MMTKASAKYGVIFTNQRTPDDREGYEEMAKAMIELAQKQSGFIDFISLRDETGLGITISYWESMDDIQRWKDHPDHMKARKLGKEKWYANYNLQIVRIEHEYDWQAL